MAKLGITELNDLYGLAMSPLMEKYAKNKYFFTNEEYKKHYGKIATISSLRWEVEKQLKDDEKT